MSSSRFPIPQGTLDMLILQILSIEPAHGYGIAQRLEQISKAVVKVNQDLFIPRCTASSKRDGFGLNGSNRRRGETRSSIP